MEKLNMKTVTKRYNGLMNFICCEHLTIGEALSENTDGWNLRDMVSEAQYQLDTYYEVGHANHLLREEGSDGRRQWWTEVLRLTRFIGSFGPLSEEFKAAARHCSKWDN